MRTIVLFVAFMFAGMAGVKAQYYTNHNKVWAFGNRAGLDFTSGVPVPFASGINTSEGSASVSDAAGHLLFYTDGKSVYNRTGAVMPSGASVVSFSTSSTTQAAVVIPELPGTSRYYIFSLESDGVVRSCRLAYSIVDMALDGGNGDVVTSSSGIAMDSTMSEKMIAVQGTNCNTWLLATRRNARQFLAYNITSAGISAPVVSSFPASLGYFNAIGAMVSTPDGRAIATLYNLSSARGVELYDFNPATGVVANRRVLDSTRMHYGGEFSPGSTRLYSLCYNSSGPSTIEQYDISLPSVGAIVASRTTIATGSMGAATMLRTGPDGKIYLNGFSAASSAYLDVINYPDLPGTSCGYTPNAITLAAGTSGAMGLPSLYVAPGFTITGHARHDTPACIPTGGNINIYPHGTAASYLWNNGDTAYAHTISNPGIHWVLQRTGCVATVDTINVIPLVDTVYRLVDTTVCAHSDTDSYVLTPPAAYNYYWYDGSSDSIHVVHRNGDYWVSYTLGCTRFTDTFRVVSGNAPAPVTGPDSVCVGSSITLGSLTTGGLWSSDLAAIAAVGSGNGVVTGMLPGIAVISYSTFPGCYKTKTVTVLAPPCITAVRETTPVSGDADIFPNPASGECTISLQGAAVQAAHVSVSDIAGRYIRSYSLAGNHTLISVADLPPGIYQCRIIINGGATINKKLVIAR